MPSLPSLPLGAARCCGGTASSSSGRGEGRVLYTRPNASWRDCTPTAQHVGGGEGPGDTERKRESSRGPSIDPYVPPPYVYRLPLNDIMHHGYAAPTQLGAKRRARRRVHMPVGRADGTIAAVCGTRRAETAPRGGGRGKGRVNTTLQTLYSVTSPPCASSARVDHLAAADTNIPTHHHHRCPLSWVAHPHPGAPQPGCGYCYSLWVRCSRWWRHPNSNSRPPWTMP